MWELTILVITSALLISFRSARNLKSFLIRSEAYPLKRKLGSTKCSNKPCHVLLNINEMDTSDSFQTKQKYRINHHLNCNDNCLICLMSCKVYGLQYVGSTINKFTTVLNKLRKMLGKLWG